MMLWEFAACVRGFNRVHGGEEPPPVMTNDEFDDLLERHGIASKHWGPLNG